MRDLSRIGEVLYGDAWQILPGKLLELGRAFEDVRVNGAQKVSDPVGPRGTGLVVPSSEYVHPQVELVGDVAIARVHGVTGKRLSLMAMECGGFDTGLFLEQLENIADDPVVRKVVIDFDSPGGMAAGNVQVVEALGAVRDAGKVVIGYAGRLCASAAYFMACGCDVIYADPDATVGSISTICYGVDSSKNWEMNGKRLELFATGKFKATGMPGKAWTEEERAMMWERVRPLDEEFKGYVSARRGLGDEEMQGQTWYARFAPKGVVDRADFACLDEVVEFALGLKD